MMTWNKYCTFLSFLLANSLFFILACQENHSYSIAGEIHVPMVHPKDTMPHIDTVLLRKKANEALLFCKENKFNTHFCLLADMHAHSGLERFFVWDFDKNQIIYSFPVSHGCGEMPWSGDYSKSQPIFSNEDGSHCSSLGKYRIGERAYSNWGMNVKYVLHGLEKSNSNALKRTIVFHSWEEIPDKNVYPAGTPEGWGCPTLSIQNFKLVDELLKQSKNAVLLWQY